MPATQLHTDGESLNERLRDELSMLDAIYPEQVKWSQQRREVTYTSEDKSATLVLRLSDGYLADTLPDVIIATSRHCDLRDRVQSSLAGRDPQIEVLDAIIEEFRCLAESGERPIAQEERTSAAPQSDATVIVWLHHLLNTNKRKQAAAPPTEVSGFTKPGYPGVLLYTGPAVHVHAHVQELKALNWQAFQVRLEADEAWILPHQGVVEVESIGDIASGLSDAHREEFLQALKIK